MLDGKPNSDEAILNAFQRTADVQGSGNTHTQMLQATGCMNTLPTPSSHPPLSSQMPEKLILPNLPPSLSGIGGKTINSFTSIPPPNVEALALGCLSNLDKVQVPNKDGVGKNHYLAFDNEEIKNPLDSTIFTCYAPAHQPRYGIFYLSLDADNHEKLFNHLKTLLMRDRNNLHQKEISLDGWIERAGKDDDSKKKNRRTANATRVNSTTLQNWFLRLFDLKLTGSRDLADRQYVLSMENFTLESLLFSSGSKIAGRNHVFFICTSNLYLKYIGPGKRPSLSIQDSEEYHSRFTLTFDGDLSLKSPGFVLASNRASAKIKGTVAIGQVEKFFNRQPMPVVLPSTKVSINQQQQRPLFSDKIHTYAPPTVQIPHVVIPPKEGLQSNSQTEVNHFQVGDDNMDVDDTNNNQKDTNDLDDECMDILEAMTKISQIRPTPDDEAIALLEALASQGFQHK